MDYKNEQLSISLGNKEQEILKIRQENRELRITKERDK